MNALLNRYRALRQLSGYCGWIGALRFVFSSARIRCSTPGLESKVWICGRSSDDATLRQVLMGRHYDYPDLPSKPDVIVDLGANIGLSLALFSERYPEARIYGFEPAPDHFEILQLNIAARPNVKPFGLLLCHRMVALA